jgi:hypothetical protein
LFEAKGAGYLHEHSIRKGVEIRGEDSMRLVVDSPYCEPCISFASNMQALGEIVKDIAGNFSGDEFMDVFVFLTGEWCANVCLSVVKGRKVPDFVGKAFAFEISTKGLVRGERFWRKFRAKSRRERASIPPLCHHMPCFQEEAINHAQSKELLMKGNLTFYSFVRKDCPRRNDRQVIEVAKVIPDVSQPHEELLFSFGQSAKGLVRKREPMNLHALRIPPLSPRATHKFGGRD